VSEPARKLRSTSSAVVPARKPSREPARKPSPEPARRAAAGRPPAAPRSNRHAVGKSRRVHLGFAIFSAVAIVAMIGGVVAMNAMLDQRAFRITALQQQVSGLQVRGRVLTEQAAALEAPGRIAEWAGAHGLVMTPQGAVVVLGSTSQRPSASGGGA
jgi:cell division protein FtsL